MTITGDFAGMGRLRSTLESLARNVPSKVSQRGAAGITRAWRAMYDAGQDPYGAAWAPLAAVTVRRKGFDTILVVSGAARDATRAVAMGGAGIRLETGAILAKHMQAEGSRPARPVMPTRGMPAAWEAVLVRAGDLVVRERMARR